MYYFGALLRINRLTVKFPNRCFHSKCQNNKQTIPASISKIVADHVKNSTVCMYYFGALLRINRLTVKFPNRCFHSKCQNNKQTIPASISKIVVDHVKNSTVCMYYFGALLRINRLTVKFPNRCFHSKCQSNKQTIPASISKIVADHVKNSTVCMYYFVTLPRINRLTVKFPNRCFHSKCQSNKQTIPASISKIVVDHVKNSTVCMYYFGALLRINRLTVKFPNRCFHSKCQSNKQTIPASISKIVADHVKNSTVCMYYFGALLRINRLTVKFPNRCFHSKCQSNKQTIPASISKIVADHVKNSTVCMYYFVTLPRINRLTVKFPNRCFHSKCQSNKQTISASINKIIVDHVKNSTVCMFVTLPNRRFHLKCQSGARLILKNGSGIYFSQSSLSEAGDMP